MIKAGIYGATGYMGGEALRVLYEHPEVDIAWISSRQKGSVEEFHPNFFGHNLTLSSPDNLGPCDVVFLALPTKAALDITPTFINQGTKVIDLGSAFRLNDKETWEKVYGLTHTEWALAEESVYGISELHKDKIKNARLIANPGCFSSAAILGLAPLIKHHLVDNSKLIVNGLSGSAGAGAELARAAHHPELASNIIAYNAVGHRHTFEMEQELSLLSETDPVQVHFTPVYVPVVRGILDICYAFPNKPISRDALLDTFKAFYADSEFVKIYDLPKDPDVSWQYKPYPWVSAVSGTNYCHIGLDYDEARNRIVVFSALDSIGKGGAHAGVENMNLMFGLPQHTGLTRIGNHPY